MKENGIIIPKHIPERLLEDLWCHRAEEWRHQVSSGPIRLVLVHISWTKAHGMTEIRFVTRCNEESRKLFCRFWVKVRPGVSSTHRCWIYKTRGIQGKKDIQPSSVPIMLTTPKTRPAPLVLTWSCGVRSQTHFNCVLSVSSSESLLLWRRCHHCVCLDWDYIKLVKHHPFLELCDPN